MTDKWKMPEDENAPVTVEEARQLFAAWEALPEGADVPLPIDNRLDDRSPDFVRLAVEQADRADAAERALAALRTAVQEYLAAVDDYVAEATRWRREYIPAPGVQRARIAEARCGIAPKRTTLDALLAVAS